MIVHIDRTSRVPLYEQIADQLRALILAQGLVSGSRLPSTRELADMLSVNRKTVVQAYRILRAENLVRGNGRGGTIVKPCGTAPEPGSATRPVLWRRLYTDSTAPSFISRDGFYKGLIRSIPQDTLGTGLDMGLHRWGDRSLLGDAWDAVLKEIDRSGLNISPVQGYRPLRDQIAKRASMAGINVSADNIMIVSNTSQMTFLLASALLNRGDSVALEVPCEPSVIHAYNVLGVQIHAVPLDDEGPDMDMLEGILVRTKPKLLHVFPTFRVPTGTSMSLSRRKELLACARLHRVPIVEMPEFDSLRYEGEPKPSLFAMDSESQTFYGTTLEHELPLALRVAWMAAPRHVIRSLIPIKQAMQTSIHPLIQALAHRILAHPEHSLEAVCSGGKRSRDQMASSLERNFSSALHFTRPEGGIYIWAEVADHVELRGRFEALSAFWSVCMPGHFFHPGMGGGERNLCFSFFGAELEFLERSASEIAEIILQP